MKEMLKQAAISIALSVLGGSFGMYVSFKILEERVAHTEARQAEDRAAVAQLATRVDDNRRYFETSVDSLGNRLADVSGDVKYIRGRMEAK